MKEDDGWAMPKRRIFLGVLLLAVLVVVGLLVSGVFRDREPEYGGKRLSEWVRKFWAPPYTNYSAQTAEAKDAIHQIGTNALPYLLKWVGYERPAWKAKLYEVTNPIMGFFNPSFLMTDEKDIRLARAAVNALIALGRDAGGGVEELTQLMDTPRGQASAGRAAMTLGGLNYPVGAEGSFLRNAIVSELRAINVDSPQSHPTFTFKKLDPGITNDWTSDVPVLKLSFDSPHSQRYVRFVLIPAKTNAGMNSALSGMPRVNRGRTNALINSDPPTWIKKGWYDFGSRN